MNYKFIAGIDQSKLTLDVCLIQSADGKKLGEKQFENTRKGFYQMQKWFESIGTEVSELLICSEHTGLYSYPLCVFCQENKLRLWLESPLQIKQSMGMQRGKNDRVDAVRIAQYGASHLNQAKLFVMPGKALLGLKQLLAYRERLVRAKKSFHTAEKEMKEFNADFSEHVSKESKSLLKTIDSKIEKVNAKMIELIESDEQLKKQFQLVQSVPGVGPITATYFLVFTSGFTRFQTSRQFACFSGIAPFEYSSGTSIRGKTRVSHLANKTMKTVLNMCAVTMLRKGNEYYDYYERKVAEGKNKMSVINAIRNKIVSRVFAVVVRGTEYLSVEEHNKSTRVESMA
jgi:transposase